MNIPTILKVLSVIGGIAGTIASANAIPGLTPAQGTTIIGVAAVVFKVTDMVETKLKAQADAGTPTLRVSHTPGSDAS